MTEKLSGQGPFGNAQDPEIVPCAVCGDDVPHEEKFMCEKEIIHKGCFLCAFCDAKLQMGYCVQELALYNRYGPCWYCTLICAHLPLAQKEGRLKENGVEVRQPATRRPNPNRGSGAANLYASSQQHAAAAAAPPVPTPTAPAQTPATPPASAVESGTPEARPVTEENVGQTVGEAAVGADDGEEMEADEVPKAAVVPAAEEAAESTGGIGQQPPGEATGGGEDGVEMEAEEVVPPPVADSGVLACELTRAAENGDAVPPPVADDGLEIIELEEVPLLAAEAVGGSEQAAGEGAVGVEAAAGAEGAGSVGAATGTAKHFEDRANKYRLQMTKKKK